MPTRKHTSNRPKLLSSSQTSNIQAGSALTNKENPADIITREGERADVFSSRDQLNRIPRLSTERAKELVAAILKDHDEDAIVMDMIELVTGIAYDPDFTERDSLAFVSTREAVMFAPMFSKAVAFFAKSATMRGTSPAPASMPVAGARAPVSSPIFAEGVSKLGRDAARAAGRLCADYTVTLKSALQAFEDEMIAETLRFYPKGGHEAAVHLGLTVEELRKLLRKTQGRGKTKAASRTRTPREERQK